MQKNSNKKIDILFMTGYFGVGGKERQIAEIIKNLPSNYRASFLVKSSDAYYFEGIKEKIYKYFNLNQSKFSILNIKNTYDAINEVKPNFVVSFSNVFSHMSLLIQKLRLVNKSFVIINASIRDAPIKKSVYSQIESFLLLFYKYVVANSYAGLRAYNQYGRKNRFVLYNGLTKNRFPKITKHEARKKLNFPPDKFIIVMIAGLRKIKDHDTFLKSINYIRCKYFSNDIIFYIIGDGPTKISIINTIKKLSLNNTYLMGVRDDVEVILKASDLSVLCTNNGEGISNTILESQFSGIPVIATEGGGTEEIIKNNINGCLIKNKDYINLSNKILLLKQDSELYNKIRTNALKSVSKFEVSSMIKNFENILKTCI